MAQAPRRCGLAVRPAHLTGAALLVLGRGEVGEIPLDARRELVRLVVPDHAETGLPPGALPATARIDAEALTQPRPLGGRDQHDSDREQGDVQPAHARESSAAPPPWNSSGERLDLLVEVGEVGLRIEWAADDPLE